MTAQTLTVARTRLAARLSLARVAVTTARYALGLLFFVPGVAGLLGLLPPPSGDVPAGALAFATALHGTGYMFLLIKGTEAVAGALLLSGRFVPLALCLLAPVVLNIVLFHAVLAPEGTAVAIGGLGLELYLAWAYRRAYQPLFVPRASPDAPRAG